MLTFLSRLSKNKYPKIIRQNKLIQPGVLFEVTNPLEEWRALSLDDESQYLLSLLRNLKVDDCFYDIGGCIGVYAFHAARYCQQVFSFEPDPGFAARLLRNADLNKANNVTLVQAAVSNRDETIYLYTSGVSGRSPSLGDNQHNNKIPVRGVTLDNLVRSGELPPPTIIKMDIEGAEGMALDGSKWLLDSPLKPRLFHIEIHPENLSRFGYEESEPLTLLKNYGYQVTKESDRDNQKHLILTWGPGYIQ